MVALKPDSRLAAFVLAVALLLVVPGRAQAQVAECSVQSVAQVFLPWSDPGWYASVPDGGLEAGGVGWRLDGGAAIVYGNEPYFVRSTSDHHSLELGRFGASAASAPTCVGLGHPTLRFFVRNTGSEQAMLTVTVEFTDPGGSRQSIPIGVISGRSDWAPSPPLPVTANTLSVLAVQKARFRFTSSGAGNWRVDDVYVDPYGKG